MMRLPWVLMGLCNLYNETDRYCSVSDSTCIVLPRGLWPFWLQRFGRSPMHVHTHLMATIHSKVDDVLVPIAGSH
eukprot:9052428-Karenia_brevis.AAC.1